MTRIYKTIPAVAILLLISSCNKEDEFRSSQKNEIQYVTIGIDVSAGGLSQMMGNVSSSTKTLSPVSDNSDREDIICEMNNSGAELFAETKANGIDDPATTSLTTIKNLWVLQYDGQGDAAKLIGTPVYIEDYTDEDNRSAKLVASTIPNTIVFLANTFDKTIPFQQNSTIAELKQRRFTTKSLGTIVTVDPNTRDTGLGSFPNDGDYYQRLNGSIEQIITNNSTLSCQLAHNACRICVNITNNTASTSCPVTLISADIENVPGCMYYFTDYSTYTTDSTKVGKPTASDLELYGSIDYSNVITWGASEGTSTITKSAKIYLSANESGMVVANTNPKLKSLFAPSRATVLRINGTYLDSLNNVVPIKYSFALGGNMTSNYQLVPNGDYVYNITINARGDKTTDGRVSYSPAGGVDYTQTTIWPLSNCYICNPPTVSGAASTYKIPVARVDQFWGGGDYEDVANNCLKTANIWTVSVIWSDMEVKPSNFTITKATGTGKDDYFEVSIPNTTEKGNVIIGIKNNLSVDWLWSWHLWVTDYCPDEARYLTQQGAFMAGTDTYHLTGGDVQRYQVAASGTVQKVYMDRNIGAMSSDYAGSGKGSLYYQYGRKDPFPGSADYWDGGVSLQAGPFIVNSSTVKKHIVSYNATDANQPSNVPFSVKNPATFIYNSQRWTYGDKYCPSTFSSGIIWQDPSASNLGGKSIFDPSPSGWKVPASFNGCTYNNFSGGFGIVNTNIIPKGGTVKFTAAGYIEWTNGNLRGVSTQLQLWRCMPEDENNAFYLQGYLGNIHQGNGNRFARAFGASIRPIQE